MVISYHNCPIVLLPGLVELTVTLLIDFQVFVPATFTNILQTLSLVSYQILPTVSSVVNDGAVSKVTERLSTYVLSKVNAAVGVPPLADVTVGVATI